MICHGFLEWWVGLSLLRCLESSAHRCGIDGDFSYPELAEWPEMAVRLRESFCRSFRA